MQFTILTDGRAKDAKEEEGANGLRNEKRRKERRPHDVAIVQMGEIKHEH